MAYSYDKKTGRLSFKGWDEGIAKSPHSGTADLKGINISSINGEASVSYNRARLDQVSLTAQTATYSLSNLNIGVPSVLTLGTWIQISSVSAGTSFTNSNWYQVVGIVGTVGSPGSINLASTFGGSQISPDAGGTFTFITLAMGVPMDYCIENHGGASSNSYRYFIIDMSGNIWISGTANTVGAAGALSPTTTWSAITPHGTTQTDLSSFSIPNGSIQIMYATNSSNKITANYLLIFTDSQILYSGNNGTNNWPSTGTGFSLLETFNYNGYYHKSILANDQVIYFTDGPGVGILQQKTGQVFNPASSATFNYVNANYLMAPTDAATRIAIIPAGNGLSIIVGGMQNNLYIYPTYQNSSGTGAGPTSIIWTQESNVQYMVSVNNYIIIFCGSKGNVYLTNGSSVVPLITVPDYVAGSINFLQDPYFVWGGATYLRGRIFFSIKDQTSSHPGNCGGIWSFIPSFAAFPQQDTGASLRMESASSLYSTFGFNGYAPVVLAGIETGAQQANGPQYLACWNQTTSNGATTTNSIDFSNTSPLTNGSSIIETDAVPVGTFLEPKTFSQIEVKFAANLVAGESVTINYRTDLSQAWANAGSLTSETVPSGNGSPLSRIILGVNFQQAQLIQLQAILVSTVTNPSWCRLIDLSII